MDSHFPLVSRQLLDPIAHINDELELFGIESQIVNTKTFLGHVLALAEALEDKAFAINLCDNRYTFLVSFCAVIVRGQTNLLPSSKNVSTQEQLQKDYTDTYIIHDHGVDISPNIVEFNLKDLNLKKRNVEQVPLINNQHIACISFTSGSTGKPKPNLKYWHTLHVSTLINYEYMIPATQGSVYQVATVPPQHMWGLETSILMALFTDVCISDGKPLFPQDIIDTLKCIPEPRILVSTPVHLRALSSYGQANLSLHGTLCATSPLNKPLAKQIEIAFKGPLIEVYGCSEVGSMAVRQTSHCSTWRKFRNITFTKNNKYTYASAAHLPETTALQDELTLLNDEYFTLAGRSTDLVKVAGKRASLLEINQTLLDFEGLVDGIVLLPDKAGDTKRLIAIVSLKNGFDKSSLQKFLRKKLDSAFVPRPIYVVDVIPRESNGKLLQSCINQLLASLRA